MKNTAIAAIAREIAATTEAVAIPAMAPEDSLLLLTVSDARLYEKKTKTSMLEPFKEALVTVHTRGVLR
jgi:hypothetical protein